MISVYKKQLFPLWGLKLKIHNRLLLLETWTLGEDLHFQGYFKFLFIYWNKGRSLVNSRLF